jgi:hypothetical protein
MNDSISFVDGAVGSAPIVISRELFARIERLAARVDMDAVDLIGFALKDVFSDPNMSLEALANLIRALPPEELDV